MNVELHSFVFTLYAFPHICTSVLFLFVYNHFFNIPGGVRLLVVSCFRAIYCNPVTSQRN